MTAARQIALDAPRRIQRRRTRGWRAPDRAVYVGRPTRFGNPARIIRADHGLLVQWGETGGSVGVWPNEAEARRYATEVYRTWIGQPEQADTRRLFRALLHGRDLMCWCPLPAPGQSDHCHAAVLLELANSSATP
ncbi:DUF4326 domain-containing protein [Streptomyces sp. NBC_01373]|uniref:DUF4326 domain-containing protein n=1 Tax=Streptomyces sp. NBC_01373 TaxID=2903843 RepID=UPI0022533B92|nr:DUF4326 domain-containing protein [Streptomyces sp. NBC_01373]MCX4697035.1 DUF4326 domain-containing protein [Streptomyces sp. NBC_01373]MCX4707040.1 DUF4326 domain-containing protein [Streptomyces sp. NBC_01373]